MIVTTTAVAFILLSVGLAVCGFWFLRASWRSGVREGGKIGQLISSFFFVSALHNGILGLGGLFFASNPMGLFITQIVSHIFLTFFAMTGVCAVYYIFLPKTSLVFPVLFIVSLGFLGIFTALVGNHFPFLTSENSIDWNMSFPSSLITFYLFFASFSSAIYIFSHLFKNANNRQIKTFSITIIILAVLGLWNTFFRLIVFYNAPAVTRTSVLDVGIMLSGLGFLVVVILIPFFRSYFPRKK